MRWFKWKFYGLKLREENGKVVVRKQDEKGEKCVQFFCKQMLFSNLFFYNLFPPPKYFQKSKIRLWNFQFSRNFYEAELFIYLFTICLGFLIFYGSLSK